MTDSFKDTFKDFHALKPLRKSLKIQHEARQAADAERLRQQKLKLREKKLCHHMVGDVTPLKTSHKTTQVPCRASEPAPFPRRTSIHHFNSTDTILSASLSDAYSIENLTGSDGHTRFARRGVGNDVFTKLQRGHWPVRKQLDLHGLRSEEARDTLAAFLDMAHQRGWRCVRIIHGKATAP